MPRPGRRSSNHQESKARSMLDGRDDAETLRSLARLRNALALAAACAPDDRGDHSVPSRPSGRAPTSGPITAPRSKPRPSGIPSPSEPPSDRRRRGGLAREPAFGSRVSRSPALVSGGLFDQMFADPVSRSSQVGKMLQPD